MSTVPVLGKSGPLVQRGSPVRTSLRCGVDRLTLRMQAPAGATGIVDDQRCAIARRA
jgi:hypothetical protein